MLFSVVRLACSVGRRVSWSVSVSHFLSAAVRRYPVFSALHLPDVGVGEGCSYLWNMRSLSLSPPHLSSAHVNPPFRSSDRSTKKFDGCESLQMHIDFFFFFLLNTHSLCWVTHGCHLFRKPSTWIYIVTSGPRSPPRCQYDGEGWALRMLTGIKRKGKLIPTPTRRTFCSFPVDQLVM